MVTIVADTGDETVYARTGVTAILTIGKTPSERPCPRAASATCSRMIRYASDLAFTEVVCAPPRKP
jgi:hypothetical protein